MRSLRPTRPAAERRAILDVAPPPAPALIVVDGAPVVDESRAEAEAFLESEGIRRRPLAGRRPGSRPGSRRHQPNPESRGDWPLVRSASVVTTGRGIHVAQRTRRAPDGRLFDEYAPRLAGADNDLEWWCVVSELEGERDGRSESRTYWVVSEDRDRWTTYDETASGRRRLRVGPGVVALSVDDCCKRRCGPAPLLAAARLRVEGASIRQVAESIDGMSRSTAGEILGLTRCPTFC
jgi:hypothetical protein